VHCVDSTNVRRTSTALAAARTADSSSRNASRLLLALVALALTNGCSLVYRSHARGEHFALYSDRSARSTARTRDRIDAIFARFIELFDVDPARLRRIAIFVEGADDGVLDHAYSPELLGYYVPFLRWIQIDTRAAMTSREAGFEQVLLHEICHHFVVHEFPQASSECWLNEGLAGNLEVAVIAGGRAEFPLLNPVLLAIARNVLEDDIAGARLADLLASDWERFHDDARREENYALAWSIVYFLLDEVLPQDLSLGERIERLYRFDRARIIGLAPTWRRAILDLDCIETLAAWASEPGAPNRLRAVWALGQLGETNGFAGARALDALRPCLDDVDAERSEAAALAFLRILARVPHAAYFAADATSRGLDRVRRLISDSETPVATRARLVESLEAVHVRTDDWYPLLVDALESRVPRMRAAAAHALAGIGGKPTISNPAFWTDAPPEARDREIAEWRGWLASHLPARR